MADLNQRNTAISPYQIRTFAFPLGGILAVIGLWPWVFHGTEVRIWALLLSSALVVPGIFFPRLLTPAYRGWMLFAEKFGWVNSRVLLGIIFYGILTPMGLVRRMAGKPSFTYGFDKQAKTYRVVKPPRSPGHMAKTF